MVVSKSRSSASLTVIAPVPELMANGASRRRRHVAGGDGPDERRDVVIAGVVDVDDGCGVGGLGDAGSGVRDRQSDVRDRDRDDLGVGGGAVGSLDREVVARGRLEVEVVGVVDGDRARGGADGERQLTVAVAVGVAVRDGPGEALVVAGRGDGDHRGVGRGRPAMLAAVSATVGATSVMVIVMSSVSAAVPSVA